MNVLDSFVSSTFRNMNVLDSIDSSTFQNMNVLYSIDSSTFQNMNVLDFISTHIIYHGILNVNILPFIFYDLPKTCCILIRTFLHNNISINRIFPLFLYGIYHRLFVWSFIRVLKNAAARFFELFTLTMKPIEPVLPECISYVFVCDNEHNFIEVTKLQT